MKYLGIYIPGGALHCIEVPLLLDMNTVGLFSSVCIVLDADEMQAFVYTTALQ